MLFRSLDQLLQPQRNMSSRAFQVERQVTGHRIGRGQGFAEVGEQAFDVDVGGDDEEGIGCVAGFFVSFRLEVVVQGAGGRVVEFLGVGRLGAGDVFFGRIRCVLRRSMDP